MRMIQTQTKILRQIQTQIHKQTVNHLIQIQTPIQMIMRMRRRRRRERKRRRQKKDKKGSELKDRKK